MRTRDALTPRDAPPCWPELRAEQEALSLVRFYSTPPIARDFGAPGLARIRADATGPGVRPPMAGRKVNPRLLRAPWPRSMMGDLVLRMVRQRPTGGQDVVTPFGIVPVRPGSGYVIVTNFGSFPIDRRSDLTRLNVKARGGNDVINVAALAASQTAELYGEGGNDRITAGRAHDVVLGGAGNDTLGGGSGDDWLEGGKGRDKLVGGIGHDVLLGGTMVDPEDLCELFDLRGLLATWRSARDTESREEFAASLVDIVLDDGARDTFTGGFGEDIVPIGLLDRIIDRRPDDLVLVV